MQGRDGWVWGVQRCLTGGVSLGGMFLGDYTGSQGASG